MHRDHKSKGRASLCKFFLKKTENPLAGISSLSQYQPQESQSFFAILHKINHFGQIFLPQFQHKRYINKTTPYVKLT